jgi:hypothetical protein
MSVPNLNRQKYKVTERFVQSGIHKYNSPESKSYVCTFKQKGRFVSSMDANNNECIGVWHRTTNGWQLYFGIDKNDNDTFMYTPIKISKNNYVIEMDGVVIESGTSKSILLRVVNTIYNAMPSNLKKNMNELYNNINSSLRKRTDQNAGVAYMTCKRIE